MGEGGGKKWINGSKITEDRSREVFQTFLHTIID